MNFVKAIRAALVPAYWRGLIRGVVPTIDHKEAFAGLEFASVVDVGANVGQFSLFASNRWPTAVIHAFEPLPDQAKKFQSLHQGRAKLHRCAVGESQGTLPLHIASRRDSSSLLPLGDRQKAMFSMEEVAQLEVPIVRLDSVLDSKLLPQPTLLKIDVQGFEYEVLRGAGELLEHFSHIYVEASFVELYEGQKLYPEIEAFLVQRGLLVVKQFNVSCDEYGRPVQCDVLFSRPLECGC